MPDLRLFLDVAASAPRVGQLLDRRLAPLGLPAYLLGVITHIRDHAPVTPSGISDASGVPLTSLRDNIQRLVDRRLVRRVPNPADGRSYLVELTARGEAMLQAADPAVLDAYLAVERRLPRPLDYYQAAVAELNQALDGALAEATEPSSAAETG